MTKNPPSLLDTFLRWCEQQIIRFPWTFLCVTLLLCGGTGYYVYNHLPVDTNTANMLSPDLPFQQNQQRLDTAFPEDAATTIFVVESNTPEETAQAAVKLTVLLSKEKDRFESVYIPTENAFFQQHALLYLDTADLETLAKKLTDAQPFIGHLAQNYSLDGLFEIISLALNKRDENLPMDLNPLLLAIDNNLTQQLAGQSQALSWQTLLADNKLTVDTKRIIVIAKPILHFDAMLPAELAQTAAHAAANSIMSENTAVKIRITGEPALEHEELESVTYGAQIAGIASLILVFVVQWVGFRSFKLLIITYIVLIMGLVFTAGFAAITVGHLNIISIAFASLYIGLGVDYAVHICLYYRDRRVRNYSNVDSIHHSMSGVGSSLFLCALTTALGFLAFIPTDYSGVSELGIISGGGIFIGLLISVTVLPALLCVMPVNNPKPIKSAFAPHWVVTFPFHYSTPIRIISILLAIGSCVVLTNLTFDSNPINLRNPKSESVSTIKELLKSKNDSPFAVNALANSLDEANKLAEKMSKLSSVHDTITLSSFVAEHQEEKLTILDDLNLMLGNQLKNFDATLNNDNQKAALIKFNDELKKAIAEKSPNAPLATLQQLQQHVEAFLKSPNPAASYTQLEKNVLGLLPFTMERLRTSLTASEFDLNDIPSDIKSHWLSADGLYRVLISPEKDQNDPDNQREFVTQVQSVDNNVSGLPIANQAGGDAVVGAFVQAFGSAFTVISLLLWAIYRNFKHMSLVIAPLLLAALLTGATNVLLDNPFNFANVIALPLLLGMGIDSSILIMHRLHFNVQEDENLLHSSTTRGIIFSSITTLCSFSSLSFTSHQGMASMGLLLSIGLFFTVICSLIVLPAFSGKRV
ncbi:hopanoid biosynthesis-associated RND transporter HpnN [Crenothrix sp. D3]|nr:hopanoid biosynthesis-associated RND transporter HpnN [Crenothrix sp. D3]